VNHHAAPDFWEAFGSLDPATQKAARNAFALMKSDPRHPSIHLKKAGRYWSARIGRNYRAVAAEAEDGLVWIWIGRHDPYERKITT
jgi:hypothetical protein